MFYSYLIFQVDIGIPQGLWDNPSAEITDLKTKCETLLEHHEEDIEDWYFNHQVRDRGKKKHCTALR